MVIVKEIQNENEVKSICEQIERVNLNCLGKSQKAKSIPVKKAKKITRINLMTSDGDVQHPFLRDPSGGRPDKCIECPKGTPIMDGNLCFDFQNKGECTRPNCKFAHIAPKNTICLDLKVFGHCSRQNSCRFAHAFTEGVYDFAEDSFAVRQRKKETRRSSARNSRARILKPCFNFQNQGYCPRGDSCPYFHDVAAYDKNLNMMMFQQQQYMNQMFSNMMCYQPNMMQQQQQNQMYQQQNSMHLFQQQRQQYPQQLVQPSPQQQVAMSAVPQQQQMGTQNIISYQNFPGTSYDASATTNKNQFNSMEQNDVSNNMQDDWSAYSSNITNYDS